MEFKKINRLQLQQSMDKQLQIKNKKQKI